MLWIQIRLDLELFGQVGSGSEKSRSGQHFLNGVHLKFFDYLPTWPSVKVGSEMTLLL